MKDLFSTEVTVSGGRDGRALSQDGKLDVALAFPTALGGSGYGTNPEQLFAAGFAACFTTSLRLSAKSMGLHAGGVRVTATVTLGVEPDGAYAIRADLVATVPGVTGADLDRLIAEARRVCAYSNALKGTAQVSVTVA
jgi:Ohr subfamily peroxiredoxin